MRTTTVLSACATVALLACASENGPTEPDASGTLVPTASPEAAAVDTWRERAHHLGNRIGVGVGVMPNSAGQSVVYTFGGCDVVEGGGGGHCTVPGIGIYNAVTGTQTADFATEVAVWRSNGVGTIGGKLYSSGGFTTLHRDEDASSRAWAYDPAARRVTLIADMPRPTAEGVTGAFDGKLYVLPGMCNTTGVRPGTCLEEPIRRLYRYNPATNRWAARKSAPHYHRLGAGAFIGGKFYVVGGFHGFQPVADLDVYNPATDTWTTRAPIPTAGRAIGTTLQGKLYVIAGSNAYVYDPGTNKWSSIAAPTWDHDGVVRIVTFGKPKLLAVGGLHGDTPNNTEVYTP